MFRQARYDEPLIFEMGIKNEQRYKGSSIIPEKLSRKKMLDIPKLTEGEVVRHYTRLSQMNFGVDSGFYPLGSCTMKYTPKIVEEIAGSEEVNVHPYQDESTVQGSLRIMYEFQEMLKEIGGVDDITLQPAAGAHGEFTGLLITKAYHESKNEERNEIILPDTAHGTNPASAHMAGYDVVEIPSENGMVNLKALKNALSEKTAAF
ncbi:MAG: aminomethyl-transferring glycine dehydrogenase subunit GcvPB, partial [Candidatus Thermoplasmatota archaeon]|nr:aminomethyl-transferring glycine dehydrogenase subunit GcvPB [Candidatus Thermoplasmatota archaeon]